MAKQTETENPTGEPIDGGGKPANQSNDFADVAKMSYEDARAELIETVQALESADAPLEETMQRWDRGEALASRCQDILDAAQAKLDERLASVNAG